MLQKLGRIALLAGPLVMLTMAPAATAQNVLVQEVLPKDKLQPPTSPSKNAWGGSIQIASKLLAWIADVGLKGRIDAEVKALQPKIDAAMPAAGGVLVIVGIQESKVPDGNGNIARSFLDAYVGGTGSTFKEAVEKFRREDRLEQGPPQGFNRRDILLWVTRPVS